MRRAASARVVGVRLRSAAGFTAIAAMMVALLLAAGCDGGDPGADPTGAGDSAGGGDGAAPERIVSLAPNVTEILFALGVGDRVVGRTEYCDHPPEALDVPVVGGWADPDPERIFAARPDLVVGTPIAPEGEDVFWTDMSDAGVDVLVVRPNTLDGCLQAITRIGAAVAREQEAAALVADIEDTLAAVEKEAAAAPGPRPPTMIVTDHAAGIVAGPDTFLADLVRIAGGRPVPADAGPDWRRLDDERILAENPAVIVDLTAIEDDRPESREARRAWWRQRHPDLAAVRDDRVHVPAGTIAIRPGPRVGELAHRLADWIRPE